MATEPVFEIVSPLGEDLSRAKAIEPAKPLAALTAQRIGLIWTEFTNGNVLLEAFEALLSKRFPGLSFVRLAPGKKSNWGGSPDPTLRDYVREERLDAAIITAGC
jgi:hypothetical protein